MLLSSIIKEIDMRVLRERKGVGGSAFRRVGMVGGWIIRSPDADFWGDEGRPCDERRR